MILGVNGAGAREDAILSRASERTVMDPEAKGIAETVVGPLGGVITLVSVGWAVISGRLRIEREVLAAVQQRDNEIAALEQQLAAAIARGDKWESLTLDLLQTNSHAIKVASAAVSSGAPTT
jgi:hypothetical protein